MHLIRHQRCVICHAYGCVPKWITSPEMGGGPYGDNVIPVCRSHDRLSLVSMYRDFPQIQTWLVEHERLDTVSKLRRSLGCIDPQLRGT